MMNIPEGVISVIGANTLPSFTYIVCSDHDFGETKEACKTKLKELYENGTSLTVVSEMKDILKIHYPLTPQILKTLKGTNNIWSSANGDLSIKYYKH